MIKTSKAFLDTNNVAHVFVHVPGHFREFTFIQKGGQWHDADREYTLNEFLFLDADQTDQDTRMAANAVRKQLRAINLAAADKIIRTFDAEDHDAPEAIYEFGFRYIKGAVTTKTVEDGLSLGYPIDSGVALIVEYNKVVINIEQLRKRFEAKQKEDRLHLFFRALKQENVVMPEGSVELIFARSPDTKLVKINGNVYYIVDSRSDASLYVFLISGMNEITVGIETYFENDDVDAVVALLLSEFNA